MTGRALTQIKGVMRGNFEAWLATQEIADRTARRCMQLHRTGLTPHEIELAGGVSEALKPANLAVLEEIALLRVEIQGKKDGRAQLNERIDSMMTTNPPDPERLARFEQLTTEIAQNRVTIDQLMADTATYKSRADGLEREVRVAKQRLVYAHERLRPLVGYRDTQRAYIAGGVQALRG